MLFIPQTFETEQDAIDYYFTKFPMQDEDDTGLSFWLEQSINSGAIIIKEIDEQVTADKRREEAEQADQSYNKEL